MEDDGSPVGVHHPALIDTAHANAASARSKLEKLLARERGAAGRREPGDQRNTEEIVTPARVVLFDYQEEIFGKVWARLEARDRDIECMVSLPTGGGKTLVAAKLIVEAIKSGSYGNALWVAPSEELLDQGWRTIQAVWEAEGVGALRLSWGNAPSTTPWKRPVGTVTFVTLQWLRAQKAATHGQKRLPEIVIVDEAHLVGAPRSMRAIEQLHWAGPRKLIGLSATPGRVGAAETDFLAKLFGRHLVVSEALGGDPIAELRKRGVLAALQFTPLSGFDSRADSLNPAHRVWKIAEDACGAAQAGRVIVFSRSTDEAMVTAAATIASGARAIAISSETPRNLRERYVSWFRDGRISVLINKELFTTGFDLPGIRTVILGGRIGSPIKYEQVLGRVSRGPAVGGVDVATVVQVEDHRKIHGMAEAYTRYWDRGVWMTE